MMRKNARTFLIEQLANRRRPQLSTQSGQTEHSTDQEMHPQAYFSNLGVAAEDGSRGDSSFGPRGVVLKHRAA
ncbi:hypothetical protein BHE74_00013100 [Ensete ventricosum]|uniref:Uncharacterized protein n=1 Tax=Ensete ventricosum TaxID=4639 RepID=A0A427AEW7_ENSVE|nr:hypothetical protein B296_00003715 [Ensete ventricosum]RWW31985.1 hypothetical protein GW17_00003362 [Ensete ventricosum]RWW78665.1 hypothetical protein BHE74_00013100 [Ensete ventricosum]RZR92505.1 hypothetical protein BHM03_00020817 [Ensete ventricosum]